MVREITSALDYHLWDQESMRQSSLMYIAQHQANIFEVSQLKRLFAFRGINTHQGAFSFELGRCVS
jgi:hypothetical protein